jgi:hypothetical protein
VWFLCGRHCRNDKTINPRKKKKKKKKKKSMRTITGFNSRKNTGLTRKVREIN